MRGEWFLKRARACKTLTNSLLQTAPLLCRKVTYDTPVPRAQTQNRQLPRVATAWARRHLPAPGASRSPKHLSQKAYLAVATVSLRIFFRTFVDSRAEPELQLTPTLQRQQSEVSNTPVTGSGGFFPYPTLTERRGGKAGLSAWCRTLLGRVRNRSKPTFQKGHVPCALSQGAETSVRVANACLLRSWSRLLQVRASFGAFSVFLRKGRFLSAFQARLLRRRT